MKQKDEKTVVVKESLFKKAFAWIKKKIKLLTTIAGVGTVLGLLIAGVDLYLNYSNDDAEVISSSVNDNTAQLIDVVNKALVQYEQLEDVEVPESLLSNPEVKVLNYYKENFKIFKLYLQNLQFSEPEDSLTEEERFEIYNNRCRMLNACSNMAFKMRLLIFEVSVVEGKMVQNPLLSDSMFVEQTKRLDRAIAKSNNDYQNTMADESLTIEEKAKLCYSRPSLIDLVGYETDLFKRYYINVLIRLRQIMNPPFSIIGVDFKVDEIAPVEKDYLNTKEFPL